MSITSDFYRERAAECAVQAQAATLDNVRDRCLRAEAAWLSMAARIARSEVLRERHAAEKASRTE